MKILKVILLAGLLNLAHVAYAQDSPLDDISNLRCEALRPREGKAKLSEQAAREERARAEWDWVLARIEEHLVQQAIRAGCDATCAKEIRHALVERSTAREASMVDYLAGRIDIRTVGVRATAARRTLDRRLAEILTPKQLAALDWTEAHFQAVMDKYRCEKSLEEIPRKGTREHPK